MMTVETAQRKVLSTHTVRLREFVMYEIQDMGQCNAEIGGGCVMHVRFSVLRNTTTKLLLHHLKSNLSVSRIRDLGAR
jgi:hypothetical protein